jgi:hypothetical protein
MERAAVHEYYGVMAVCPLFPQAGYYVEFFVFNLKVADSQAV